MVGACAEFMDADAQSTRRTVCAQSIISGGVKQNLWSCEVGKNPAPSAAASTMPTDIALSTTSDGENTATRAEVDRFAAAERRASCLAARGSTGPRACANCIIKGCEAGTTEAIYRPRFAFISTQTGSRLCKRTAAQKSKHRGIRLPHSVGGCICTAAGDDEALFAGAGIAAAQCFARHPRCRRRGYSAREIACRKSSETATKES
jgi:hypothetical protein